MNGTPPARELLGMGLNPRAVGATLISPALQRWETGRKNRESRRDDAAMGHTYDANFIHCIFSTKDRRPLILPDRRVGLYAYFGGIAKGEAFTLIEAGGTADHVHLLFLLPPKYPLAQAVQKLKGASSHWLGPDFAWQQGYGAFSVSPSQVPLVRRYIQNQQAHHLKRNFEQEFLALLRQCGVDYDPRCVFG
jgi:putative transposase